MKNGLRLIVIVLKTAVAAYLLSCVVGLLWLKQIRRELEKFGRMQPKEHRNGETESETRKPIRVFRRYGGAPSRTFRSRSSWEIAWK